MKKATIISVPAGGAAGFAWKWQAQGASAPNPETFELYFDCVSDARLHGYAVELTHAAGESAPGGSGFSLKGPGA